MKSHVSSLAFALAAASVLLCCTGEDPSVAGLGPGGSEGGPPSVSPTDPQSPAPALAGGFDIDTVTAPSLIRGTSTIAALKLRRDGFDGPVSVTIQNAPKGVSALPLVVPAGTTDASLTLVAAADAPQGAATIGVVVSDAAGQTKHEKDATLLVRGAPGELDETFGHGGTALLPVGALVAGVAVQPDGRIVLGSTIDEDFLAIRVDGTGALDATFGNTGQSRADFVFDGGQTTDMTYGVALTPDGHVYLSGSTITNVGSRYAVARFDPSGSLDTGFAGTGYAFSEYGPMPSWTGDLLTWTIASEPDGSGVFGGTVLDSSAGGDRMVMARYKTNGRIDDGPAFFGGFPSAKVGDDDRCQAIAIEGGKIVCGGTSRVGADSRMIAWRVNDDGTADKTFHDPDGVAVIPATALGHGEVWSAHALPQGRVALTGTSSSDGLSKKAATAVLSAAGALDGSFNGTGTVTYDWGQAVAGSVRSALDGAGRVVAVGPANAADHATGIARILPSGAFDEAFGAGGKRVLPPPAGFAGSGDVYVALHPDGRIVVAQTVRSTGAGNAPQVFLMRLWP